MIPDPLIGEITKFTSFIEVEYIRSANGPSDRALYDACYSISIKEISLAHSPDLPPVPSTQSVEQVEIHDHVCLIYRNQEEEFAADIPFLAAGLRLNDQCVYIAEESRRSDVLSAMKRRGVDVEQVLLSGQLVVMTEQHSYLKDGVHDPDSTIRFFSQASQDSQSNGFRALRGVGEMDWSLGGNPGSERLIEYEAKLNHFFSKQQALAICQYNVRRFSAETIREVLYTHPKVIINNLVCSNPYYKPPKEFFAQEHGARLEVGRMLKNIYQLERDKLELMAKVRELEQQAHGS